MWCWRFYNAVPKARAQGTVSLETPRPIEAEASLWTEDLTWMEVRDAVKSGKTTIIIGTGGVEQNGPYVVGGKHNYVLQTVFLHRESHPQLADRPDR